jgi:hypothetical protein
VPVGYIHNTDDPILGPEWYAGHCFKPLGHNGLSLEAWVSNQICDNNGLAAGRNQTGETLANGKAGDLFKRLGEKPAVNFEDQFLTHFIQQKNLSGLGLGNIKYPGQSTGQDRVKVKAAAHNLADVIECSQVSVLMTELALCLFNHPKNKKGQNHRSKANNEKGDKVTRPLPKVRLQDKVFNNFKHNYE